MDRQARFRELFESTYQVLSGYGRHRGLAGEDLEDLVAATYEVAWRRFDAVPRGDAAVPWLLTVALNHLRNHRRKLERDRDLLERLPAPTPTADIADRLDPGDYDWRQIRRALDQLSHTDRELVLLVAWDELSPSDAGVVLGISAGAARTRLHRARVRLGDLLGRKADASAGHGDTDRPREAPATTVRRQSR
jgi:RNA polymerase sigma-70 factor (ECF subfamily)